MRCRCYSLETRKYYTAAATHTVPVKRSRATPSYFLRVDARGCGLNGTFYRVVAIEGNGDLEDDPDCPAPNRFQAVVRRVDKCGTNMIMRGQGVPYGLLHATDFDPSGPNCDDVIAAFGKQPETQAQPKKSDGEGVDCVYIFI